MSYVIYNDTFFDFIFRAKLMQIFGKCKKKPKKVG